MCSQRNRRYAVGRNIDRPSLYQEVTDKIVAELEAGRVPWVQPWGGACAGLGLPRNAAAGRPYSGINILILWGAVIERGYAAQVWIHATCATLHIGGERAFYSVGGDFVQVPPPQAFFEPINWHRTAFHELGHWTGHVSRLARDLSGSFGSKPYAREELVAEMTAAFVCAALGIIPTVRHADYIGSWLDVLRADNRAIFHAASQASKAADFLLAFGAAPAANVA